MGAIQIVVSLALMGLPVVCLCKVRELDGEWRDSVDRGSRLPRALLGEA